MNYQRLAGQKEFGCAARQLYAFRQTTCNFPLPAGLVMLIYSFIEYIEEMY